MSEEVEVVTSGTVTPAEPEKEVITGEPAVKPETSATSEESEDPSAPPKRKGVGKRIDELVYQREQSRREAEYWREQALKREQPKEVEKVEPEGKPKESEYNSYSEYLEALADFKLEQRISQERDKSSKAESEYRERQAINTFDEKANKLREQFEDFDDVAFGNFPVTKHMSEAILSSDLGPEILYHLGNNPKEAARISKLPPSAAAREIGKLEARLPELKKVTSAAPAPITPVKPKSSASENPSSSDDMKTWVAKRRKQLKR